MVQIAATTFEATGVVMPAIVTAVDNAAAYAIDSIYGPRFPEPLRGRIHETLAAAVVAEEQEEEEVWEEEEWEELSAFLL